MKPITLAYLTPQDCHALSHGFIAKLKPILVSHPHSITRPGECTTARLQRLNDMIADALKIAH